MRDIKIIVAIGRDGSIGKEGNLIWNLPGDLKRFKSITMGYPVVMGRKTWESLPKKPLPGRLNIIMTRNKDFKAEGALICHSVDEVLKSIDADEIFIIGGAEIYRMFLPFATKLLLTMVEDECPEADAVLEIDFSEWKETGRSEELINNEGIRYNYVDFEKVS